MIFLFYRNWSVDSKQGLDALATAKTILGNSLAKNIRIEDEDLVGFSYVGFIPTKFINPTEVFEICNYIKTSTELNLITPETRSMSVGDFMWIPEQSKIYTVVSGPFTGQTVDRNFETTLMRIQAFTISQLLSEKKK